MTAVPRYAPSFPQALEGFDFATLERDVHAVFALDADLRFTYFNESFGRFFVENGGTPGWYPLGRPFLEFIRGPLRALYGELLTEVLLLGTAWHHEYACHSPTLFREYYQGVYPLPRGAGLVVINSLKVSRPMELVPSPPLEERYLQPTGMITQCSNCRRTERSDGSGVWDWVPAWVRHMPDEVSHSLCSTCFDYYWKRPANPPNAGVAPPRSG